MIGFAAIAASCYSSGPGDEVGEHYDIEEVYLPTTTSGYQYVPSAISDDEAAAIEAAADWTTAPALPETAPDGSPAVFYTVIRIDSLDHFDLLDQARLVGRTTVVRG
ncbi:MAG: hypothetical protein J0L92_28745 [Deltaproteobacteria bacterium]|nr:hypothetical protein [Deltaproteobacteria bacterium]